jgi:hypothetical protein
MECTVHKLIADVAVFAEGRVLLVKYRDTGRYDGQEGWFLPDDFLEHLEHPDDASRRILDEQIGVAASVPRSATSNPSGTQPGTSRLGPRNAGGDYRLTLRPDLRERSVRGRAARPNRFLRR